MKKKILICVIVFIAVLAGYNVYRQSSQPDGNTAESREEILNAEAKGREFKIYCEQEIGDYTVSGIYSNAQDGIAVFEPDGNRHKLILKELRRKNDIIITGCIMDGKWYNIVWFNGAETNYAELIYTIDGVENEPIVYDVSNREIICSEKPEKDYTLTVKYYDSDGNVYE